MTFGTADLAARIGTDLKLDAEILALGIHGNDIR